MCLLSILYSLKPEGQAHLHASTEKIPENCLAFIVSLFDIEKLPQK